MAFVKLIQSVDLHFVRQHALSDAQEPGCPAFNPAAFFQGPLYFPDFQLAHFIRQAGKNLLLRPLPALFLT